MRVSASHCHLVGRHLPLQVVDIDLGSKSDIHFIIVTLICIWVCKKKLSYTDAHDCYLICAGFCEGRVAPRSPVPITPLPDFGVVRLSDMWSVVLPLVYIIYNIISIV